MQRTQQCGPALWMYTILLRLLQVVYFGYCIVRDALAAMFYTYMLEWDTLPLTKAAHFVAPQHLAVIFPLDPKPPVGEGAWARHALNRHAQSIVDAVEDVRRLIRWSAMTGTSELTIYDTHGQLADTISSMRLSASLSSERHIAVDVHLGANTRSTSVALSTVDIAELARHNRCVTTKKVRVNFLSSHDDKPALVAVVNAIPPAELSVATIEREMRRTGLMASPPDIVMVCGFGLQPPQLLGFPCWVLRLSTIGYVPTWHGVGRWTAAHYLDMLSHYGQTEQRYGK